MHYRIINTFVVSSRLFHYTCIWLLIVTLSLYLVKDVVHSSGNMRVYIYIYIYIYIYCMDNKLSVTGWHIYASLNRVLLCRLVAYGEISMKFESKRSNFRWREWFFQNFVWYWRLYCFGCNMLNPPARSIAGMGVRPPWHSQFRYTPGLNLWSGNSSDLGEDEA